MFSSERRSDSLTMESKPLCAAVETGAIEFQFRCPRFFLPSPSLRSDLRKGPREGLSFLED